MENSQDRRRSIPKPFNSVESLREHFSRRLSPELFDEVFNREKAVFIIRRDSSLADTRAQFLTRLQHVLEDLAQGREAPDLPIFIGDGEAFQPRLR